jgi:hypothetical protein
MKTLWLCFALVAVLLATAVAQTSQFDALTTITSATVTNDGIEIVNGLVEDDDFLYFYTLSPVVISKVNKSELAIEGSTPDIPSTRVQLSLGETVATALLVNGHVYLIGQRTVFKVSVANFSDVTTLVFPVDVNPMTSFYSEDSANTQYLNFPSYGSGTPLFYQVRLDKFDLPPVNASRTFALPDGDDIQVTSYNGNGTAFMATYNGKFYKVAMESFSLQLNFSFSDISVVDVEYDNDRNTLYFCGDITPSLGPYLVKIELDKVTNGASLTIPRDPTYVTRTQTDAANGITATYLGPEVESTGKSFSIDTYGGQAVVSVYDPPSSSGALIRVNMNTMEILEEGTVDTSGSSKPIAGLMNINARLMYIITETDIVSVFFPVSCTDNCNDNGICVFSVCQCDPAYMGEACDELACDNDCGEPLNQGRCSNGRCICTSSWTGSNCTQQRCPDDCSANGDCDTSTYTCSCKEFWTGDNCATPVYRTCSDITTQDICIRKVECGWCASVTADDPEGGSCVEGSKIGPANGVCSDWHYTNKREIGLIIVAAIIIGVFGLMVLNNIVSAIKMDLRTAKLLIDDDEIGAEFLKTSWWREERSNKSWKLFDQLQFISFYVVANVGFPARLVFLTRYFNWANFVLPLPWITSTAYYPDRVLNPVGGANSTSTTGSADVNIGGSRELLNFEQFANSADLDPEYVFYACLFWFAIAIVGVFVLYIIFSLILIKARSKIQTTKRVVIQKAFHVLLRMLLAFYMPICFISAYYIRRFFNLGIIGGVFALAVFGIGLPILNALIVWGKDKELHFLYLRMRFGAFYTSYHYKKAKFNLIYLGRKFLVGIMLGFLASTLADGSIWAYVQIFVCIGVMIGYLIALVIVRPYLDMIHFYLDIALNVLNIVTLGIALLHLDTPSLAGEVVAAALQAVGFLLCIGAYIHSWMMMRKSKNLACCGGKKKEEEDQEVEMKDGSDAEAGEPSSKQESSKQQSSSKKSEAEPSDEASGSESSEKTDD